LSQVLLDTSVLVDAERSDSDLEALIEDHDAPAMAAITVAELGVGVALASGRRRARRKAFLEALIETFPVIDYDVAIAHVHGQLLVASRRTGRPRGAHDLVIAATARATGRTIVTGDVRGFEGLPGVRVRTG
jgi:tRNA(fMet)-specific endonuclease VapC